MKEEEDHVISQAEIDNWQRGREQKRIEPADFNSDDLRVFVQLASRDASSGEFETKLGLSRRDVNFHRVKLGIHTTEEARRMLRQIDEEIERVEAEELNAQRAAAHEARLLAEKRLKDMEAAKAADLEAQRVERAATLQQDQIFFKEEDAKRQRNFQKEQSKSKHNTDWRLPIESRNGEEEKVRFSNDIVYRGMRFTREKYQVTDADIQSEAARLGLTIRWELVRP